MQGAYYCCPGTELLELDCLEMDDVLRFIVQKFAPSGVVKLVNAKNKQLKCTADLEENMLKARGLGRFIQALERECFFVTPAEGETFFLVADNLCRPLFISDNFSHPRICFSNTGGPQDILGNFSGDRAGIEDYYLHHQGLTFALSPGFDTLLSTHIVRNVQPFDYQIRTVQHVLQHMRGRALLCDEVGLGKTVEAGLIMMEYIMRGLAKKILILTPPSLIEQWQEEMRSKFNLDFKIADGSEFKNNGQGWQQYDRLIASVDKAKRKGTAEQVYQEDYDLVIVDEVHHLKNRKTQGWQLANRLKKRYILLLTATPVENDLEEIFNLITLLSPGQLDTAGNFRRRYISKQDRLKPNNVNDLKGFLRDVMVRNRRSETGSILTHRHADTIEVELTSEEHHLYEEVTGLVRGHFQGKGNKGLNRFVLKTLQREVGSSSRAVIPTLEKLVGNRENPAELQEKLAEMAAKAAQIKDNAKARMLLELLSRQDGKVIIFTGFQSTRAYLFELLTDAGLEAATFHGGMRRAEKEQAIKDFSGAARVLISTESGGEGRNLQFCNTMVNYDLPWNPMRIEQRIGRIHRVGQTRDVYIYNLSARDTIEASILELLDAKLNMFRLVVGELDMILGNLKQKQDFEDLLLEIWAGSKKEEDCLRRMQDLGEELVQAREHYRQVKEVDERLLGELVPDVE